MHHSQSLFQSPPSTFMALFFFFILNTKPLEAFTIFMLLFVCACERPCFTPAQNMTHFIMYFLISKGGCCAVSQFKNIHAYRSRLKMEMYSNSSQNTCEPLPHTRARTHTQTGTHRMHFSVLLPGKMFYNPVSKSILCLQYISGNI